MQTVLPYGTKFSMCADWNKNDWIDCNVIDINPDNGDYIYQKGDKNEFGSISAAAMLYKLSLGTLRPIIMIDNYN